MWVDIGTRNKLLHQVGCDWVKTGGGNDPGREYARPRRIDRRSRAAQTGDVRGASTASVQYRCDRVVRQDGTRIEGAEISVSLSRRQDIRWIGRVSLSGVAAFVGSKEKCLVLLDRAAKSTPELEIGRASCRERV